MRACEERAAEMRADEVRFAEDRVDEHGKVVIGQRLKHQTGAALTSRTG